METFYSPSLSTSQTDARSEGLREQLTEIRRLLRDLCAEVESLHSEPEMRLKTREETANVLGISESKLDDLADQGRIRPVRIDRRVFYTADEIHRFIRRQRRGDGQG